jgi:hypothetical protein
MNQEIENRIRQLAADSQRQRQQLNASHPDAPGCENLPAEARKNAAELFGQHVMSKSAGSLDSNERAFLLASINATLKGM